MKIQQELFHRTQTTEDFLFYKTDEKDVKKTTQSLSEPPHASILEKFPELLSGNAFKDKAQTLLKEKECFGIMAIGLDKSPGTQGKPSIENVIEILECIRTFCAEEEGLWGKLESDLLACVFPGKDKARVQIAGQTLQKKLGKPTVQTITIGMAAYPCLAYEKTQIIECALKALNHAAFFGPGSRAFFDAVSLNISGDQFYQNGNIDGAIAEYKLALQIDPEDVNVLNSMGVCHAVMGNFDTALSYFESAGRYDPDEVMAWYNSALLYKLKGNKKKALDYFLTAHSKKKDSFEIAFQTGKIYFETGNEKAGRKYYQKALTLSHEAEGNQRFVGDCHLALNDPSLALKAYKIAVKENPNDAYALSALGMLYDQKGENPEIALVFCQQSVDISPKNSLFRRRLALLHLKQKLWDKALEEFKMADQLDFKSHGSEHIPVIQQKKKSANQPPNSKKPKDERSVA